MRLFQIFYNLKMEEIRKLEKKIKKDKKYLEEILSRKFKKSFVVASRDVIREERKELWKARKGLIENYTRLCTLGGRKFSIHNLAKFLGVDDKTARKYYQLWNEKQDLEYHKTTKPVWNANYELRKVVIAMIAKAIQRTDKHLGKKVLLTLKDLIYDIQKDLKLAKPLVYSTVHSWVRNLSWLDYKYSTRKRRFILRRVKIVKDRLEFNQKKLNAMRKAYAAQTHYLAVENATRMVNDKVKIIRATKEKLFAPGVVVQMDGATDVIHNNLLANRLQVVDATGYSYTMNYTPTETNMAYQIALRNVFKLTKPVAILCDRRKGVDPVDRGALIAAICHNLGITVLASSDANHKALVEKNHGLIRSRASLYFSRNNIRSIKEANHHSVFINNGFNASHSYQKPSYNGKRVAQAILDFIISKDLKVIKPYSSKFISFRKNAYQILGNDGKPILIDVSEVYVVGHLDEDVRVLFQNKLYRTRVIDKLDLTTEQFNSKLLNDKFRNNGMVVINKESMRFWIQGETTKLRYVIEQKTKRKYQRKIEQIARENQELKEVLNDIKKVQ